MTKSKYTIHRGDLVPVGLAAQLDLEGFQVLRVPTTYLCFVDDDLVAWNPDVVELEQWARGWTR